MKYTVGFKPKALRDLESLSPEIARRILAKIDLLRERLGGDVRRLTNFTPEYRLRVGDYRILFEIDGDQIVIYRIRHRRDVYRR